MQEVRKSELICKKCLSQYISKPAEKSEASEDQSYLVEEFKDCDEFELCRYKLIGIQ